LFLVALWFSGNPVLAATQLSQKPEIATRQLTNGIRAVVVHFPHSTNLSIYTFSPLSLATDAAHQAQWSHLVEHMVIRSTVAEDVRFANAETLPDHMRLDFYGNIGNWQEGLAYHREWLRGIPFTQTNLDKEKPKVNRECDFTARNFATHKFAIATWNQGFRQGVTQVKLKGDVLRATLPEIQTLRDRRLVISNQVTVCVVGGHVAVRTRIIAGKNHRHRRTIGGRQRVAIEIELTVFNDENGWGAGWRIDNRVGREHLVPALEVIARRQV
jgi:hypothetical protein